VQAAESGPWTRKLVCAGSAGTNGAIARDVPGLFKPESEPEQAAVDQEQDVDSREEDTGDLEESDYLAKVNLKGKDDRAAAWVRHRGATNSSFARRPSPRGCMKRRWWACGAFGNVGGVDPGNREFYREFSCFFHRDRFSGK
jgi:hypothetical protein